MPRRITTKKPLVKKTKVQKKTVSKKSRRSVKTGAGTPRSHAPQKKAAAKNKKNVLKSNTVKTRKSKQIKEQQIISSITEYEKVEREKKLIMWAGVTFFMILILALWIFNVKAVFFTQKQEQLSKDEFNWDEFRSDLGDTINQAKEEFSQVKNTFETKEKPELTDEQIKKQLNSILPAVIDQNISSTTDDMKAASTSPSTAEQDIEELKNRIKELEEKMK